MSDRYWQVPVYWTVGPFDTAEEARQWVGNMVHDQWILMDTCDHGPEDYDPDDCWMPEFIASTIGEAAESLVDEDENERYH